MKTLRDLPNGMKVLTVEDEQREVLSVLNSNHIVLEYKGQMKWSKQYGIDSRMWNVISPVLPEYDYSSGGYPTLTIEGLTKRGLI